MTLRCLIPALLAASHAVAGSVKESPQRPLPVSCSGQSVFAPFSLVTAARLPKDAQPITGRIVRLDFCSDETAGTLTFQRLVVREMKVKNLQEVASYLTVIPDVTDVIKGLAAAAFNDTRELQLTLRTGGDQGIELRGGPDGESVSFAYGKFDGLRQFVPSFTQWAVLESEDRIASADEVCGAEAQLERSLFQVGKFRLQSEACRLTRQFGSRYTFRKLSVEDEGLSQQDLPVAAFQYKHTHHNANDGWTLTFGARQYTFEITDDIEMVGDVPTEVKFFRRKESGRETSTKIVDGNCGPLACRFGG